MIRDVVAKNRITIAPALLAVLLSAHASLAQAAVTVDNTQKFQVMRGFGACSAWTSSANLSADAAIFWADDSAAPVASTASHIDGHIGLSMLRTRIDPTGNFASEAGPMTLAKGQNPNILIWSTEWSPPAAYKNNNNVNGPGATNTFNNTAANSTAYANYLTNYVNTIKNTYGVTLYGVSPQNEPDWNTSYESCLWTSAQFLDFVKNYMGPAFKAAGFSTTVMITDSFKDDLTLAAPTMNDATAAGFVSVVCGHIYGGGPYALASGNFSQLTNQEYWETEMSDVSGAANDPSMTSGLQIAGWIHSCIVTAGMNAYHAWWLRPSGNTNEALTDVNGNTTKKTYVMGNYSKFIRPGFQRIGATAAPAGGVNCSAYSNASRVVIVATNSNTSANSQTFALNGLNVTSLVPWITDPNNNLVQQAAISVAGNAFTYSLPAQSLVTFVGDFGSAQTPTRTFSPTTPSRTPTPTMSFTATPTLVPCALTRRMRGGATASYTDGQGNTWLADQVYAAGGDGYTAGTALTTTNAISGTTDQALYQTERYNPTLEYRFTVPNGTYRVTLKAAETYWTAAGQRVFNIALQGNTVASGVDLFALAGANKAYDMTFWVPVTNGILDIVETATADNAKVDAIEVVGQISQCTSTPTPTAASTSTSTASPTKAFSQTFTASPTPTRSASPTISASPTLSVPPTPSETASLTPVPRTATPSSSQTPLPAPSATLTPRPSASSTLAASASSTPNPVSSATLTQTSLPTPSVAASESSTPGPVSSATITHTSLPTPSIAASASATPTAVYTPVPTVSPTPMAASPTGTPTDLPTPLQTETRTPAPSPRPTGTPSASPTLSPSMAATTTATSTPTRTATASPSFTASSTKNPTSSATPTLSPTASTSPSPLPFQTLTSTSTLTPWQGGALKIDQAIPVPNPEQGGVLGFALKLEGQAGTIRLSLYTLAMRKVGAWETAGNFGPGWVPVRFPSGRLAKGVYYFVLEAVATSGETAKSRVGKLYVAG